MSIRNIAILLVTASLLAMTVAPGASACAGEGCPWYPVTSCPPNVPDCIEATAGLVRTVGGIVSGLICDVLC